MPSALTLMSLIQSAMFSFVPMSSVNIISTKQPPRVRSATFVRIDAALPLQMYLYFDFDLLSRLLPTLLPEAQSPEEPRAFSSGGFTPSLRK